IRSASFFSFFFSSRRRHTRFDCDWSSDVCSSDLEALTRGLSDLGFEVLPSLTNFVFARHPAHAGAALAAALREQDVLVRHFRKRSEERRVGKECRYRWVAEQ